MFRRLRSQRGFTLIESLIVANLLGITSLVAVPSYQGLVKQATDTANQANLRTAVASIEVYYQDNDGYAGMTLGGLQNYDVGLNAGTYTLTGVTGSTYCIQSPQGPGVDVWRKNGPRAGFENAPC